MAINHFNPQNVKNVSLLVLISVFFLHWWCYIFYFYTWCRIEVYHPSLSQTSAFMYLPRWVLSFVQTVSPNPILCISGWNLIWITDCPHSISQLFISDLCVHTRFLFFTECALVSMVMPLRCNAYAKNNSNSNTVCNTDVVLPSRLRCSIIFRLVRQRQKRSKLECVAYSMLQTSATLLFFLFFIFFCCLRYFQNTKRCVY